MKNVPSDNVELGFSAKGGKKTDQEKALEKSCPHCWGPLDAVSERLVRCSACSLTFEVIPRDDNGVRLRLKNPEKKGEKSSSKEASEMSS